MLSEQEWISQIAQVMQWDGRILSIPRKDLPEELIHPRLHLKQDWIMDSSQIRQELDYSEMIPLDEALRRTISWEKENPPRSCTLKISLDSITILKTL